MQLRAPSRTRTRRSLFRSLAGILIASAALAAFLASSLGARPVRAASSSAFIRINQLGYATTATNVSISWPQAPRPEPPSTSIRA